MIVLVMSTEVAEDDDIHSFLRALSSTQGLSPEERAHSNCNNWANTWPSTMSLVLKVLQDKTVHRLGRRTHGRCTFVALHKAKVHRASFEERHIRSRGPDSGIFFGTLTLNMDVSRQRMTDVKVGIIDVGREPVYPRDADALVAWAVWSRIDMLTGFFGKHRSDFYVADLATRTHAISWAPLYQAIRSRGDVLVHPSFYLFYGFYKAITVPEEPPEISDALSLGGDMWRDMVPLKYMPSWQKNDRGSAFVRHLGVIKMKQVDWKRWFDGCFQTVLWLGTSTPSIASQEAQRKRGETKGRGKGKGGKKGQGKGTLKGKGR
jgi:hypothetical protein